MKLSTVFGIGALAFSLGLCAQETPVKEGQASEAKGLAPRATPSDYPSQAQAGSVTIAADFKGHNVPTEDAPYTSEDFVVVEVALFGPRTKISMEDFSLRVNGKKGAIPTQSYVEAFKTMKDPEWEPPKSEAKSKTSIGGGGQNDSSPPPVVHMPLELRRAMQQRVVKAALPEGDRTLPQAGLIFFPYRGKESGIHSVELIYSGPAGKATVALQR